MVGEALNRAEGQETKEQPALRGLLVAPREADDARRTNKGSSKRGARRRVRPSEQLEHNRHVALTTTRELLLAVSHHTQTAHKGPA